MSNEVSCVDSDSPSCGELELARLEDSRHSFGLLEKNATVSPIQLIDEPKRKRLFAQDAQQQPKKQQQQQHQYQRQSVESGNLLRRALQPPGYDRRSLLLSSTMLEANQQDDADWPNASSIHLNTRDSLSLPQRDLSHLLRTEPTSLGLSSVAEVASSPQPQPEHEEQQQQHRTEAASSSNLLNCCCIEAVAEQGDAFKDAAATGDALASPVSTLPSQSAPKRQLQAAEAAASSSGNKQPAISLLQVSRLVLQILVEGDLLLPEARRWLTPELLCDKICASINSRPSHSAETETSLSDCLCEDSLDNAAKVKRWLVNLCDAKRIGPNSV